MDVKPGKMDFWHRATGKSRIQRITIENIRHIINVHTTVIEEIQRRHLVWYGHVQRMDKTKIPKQILKWTQKEGKEHRKKTREALRQHIWEEYKRPCRNVAHSQEIRKIEVRNQKAQDAIKPDDDVLYLPVSHHQNI